MPGEETFFRTYFINKPTIPNPNKAAGAEEETLPLGQRLIAKNDCKTCHNEKVQTIGPAYKQVAERYPWNEETVTALANKVKAGGSGIWGSQAMSAHPELPVTDAMEMVSIYSQAGHNRRRSRRCCRCCRYPTHRWIEGNQESFARLDCRSLDTPDTISETAGLPCFKARRSGWHCLGFPGH